MTPVTRIWKRTPPAAESADAGWDLEVRPRRAVRTSRIVAAVIAIVFILAGVLSDHSHTGVNFRGADQVAVIVFGLLLAGAVLLLTRPRVQVGAQGVVVRNVLGDNKFQWKDILGVSIPEKKSWARLELVNDEYVPMLAIRVNDRDYAARALDRFRELGAKYTATSS